MKYRSDFVTNSSSSSYICEICKREDSGYNLGLSDLGFVECVNGHIFCEEHLINKETNEDEDFDSWSIPSECCPICQFKEISNDDLDIYKNVLLKKTNDELKEQIKNGFKDYNNFKKFLEKNRK